MVSYPNVIYYCQRSLCLPLPLSNFNYPKMCSKQKIQEFPSWDDHCTEHSEDNLCSTSVSDGDCAPLHHPKHPGLSDPSCSSL